MSNPNRPILDTDPSFIYPDATSPETNHALSYPRAKRKLPAIVRADRENGMFYDEDGRVRVFHGMAVSYKLSPYHPNLERFDPVMSFAEDDMRLFDKLNLNLVRLGISWAAVQPQRGSGGFDLDYLAKLKRLVARCEHAGLYVVVECHQDLFSEKFNGDGAPAWAITKDWSTLPFPFPMGFSRAEYTDGHSMPTNMNYSDNWGLLHGADAVTRAFWGLYTDDNGVQEEFVRFWQMMAETFTGMSNVIGYGELFFLSLHTMADG